MTLVRRCVPLLALLFSVSACVTTRGELWAEGEPRRLADANLVMSTTWETGGKPSVETRSAIVEGGAIRVSVDTPTGRREGTATADDWATLWSQFGSVVPWDHRELRPYDRKVDAGPYHVVTMRVGRWFNEWSAQQGAGVLGIESRESVQRIKLTNAIFDFVESRATTEVRKGPPPKAPASRETPKDGKRS